MPSPLVQVLVDRMSGDHEQVMEEEARRANDLLTILAQRISALEARDAKTPRDSMGSPYSTPSYGHHIS